MAYLPKLAGLARLPDWLDWALSLVERLIALAIAFLAFYFVWVSFRPGNQVLQAQMMQMLKSLSDNWKAVLLVLIPLFYRTVRLFLEQTEEAFGLKRGRPLTGEGRKERTPKR